MIKRKLNEEQTRRINHTHNCFYLLMRYWEIMVDLDESDNRELYDIGFGLYDTYDAYSAFLSLFILVKGFYDAAATLQPEITEKIASAFSIQQNENNSQKIHNIYTELSTGEQLDLTKAKPTLSLDCQAINQPTPQTQKLQ